MMDMLLPDLGGVLLSTGFFGLVIGACILMERHLARARRAEKLCWMCEKRPARPGGAECKRCRKVYEAATQERIAA